MIADDAVCPTCSEIPDSKGAHAYRPFCSERCRLLDLGNWLDERYKIPDPAESGGHGELA